MSAGLLLAGFVGALVSSVVPFVNAELLLVGLALAASPAVAALLVVAVATGQMVGKCTLFLTGGRLAGAALAPRLARWRLDRVGRRGGAPLVAASAALGLPPFYLLSVAAPALGIRFRTFVLVGLAGRIVRFAAVLVVPALVSLLTH